MARVGVLLVAYGGPRSLDEVGPFITSIMGSAPSDAALQDAHRRYLTIGGVSPLPFTAERIAVQLERSLNGLPEAPQPDEEGMGLLGVPAPLPRATEDVKIPVVLGMLHSEPSIAAAVQQLASAGVGTMVVVSLSPFECASTTGKYERAVAAAVEATGEGMRIVDAAKYHTSAPFVSGLADGLTAALQTEELADRRTLVVFSAHSLPVSEIEADPCYVDQLRETAEAVAYRVDFGPATAEPVLEGVDAFGGGENIPWLLAFQSKGKRGGEWIGPDLDQVIDAAVGAGYGAVVVSPIGFAVDHMETLYDLDVMAAERALDAGLEFARAAAPNDSADMVEALAESVRKVI